MSITSRLGLHIGAALFALLSICAYAEDEESYELTAEEMQQIEHYQALLESLNPRAGKIELDGNLATLNVPDDFYFLDATDAEKVLVDIWGNPPGQNVLGMLFPTGYTPADYDAWAVTIDYVADGYVSDDDAADIDYDELLVEMRDEIRKTNPDREAAGYESIELVGWAESPHYDEANKKLYWAKELRFGGSDETTLNYEIRALGRHGILTMTFIAASNQLAEINASRDAVLTMAEFSDGNRYIDFDPSVDKVAAYGIGALVAGKLAAKAGIFTMVALFAKKFGIFIVIAIAGFGRKLVGMFKTDKLEPGQPS
jgi:uncharacterized membrane-anchored protein